jgi:hypothetical protein
VKWLTLFLLLSPFALSGQGGNLDTSTGNGLYAVCSEPVNTENAFENGLCSGYIVGSSNAFAMTAVDVPAGVSNGQLTDIVKKYLTDHPAERHKPSNLLILTALFEAFPPKSQGNK